MLRSCRFTRHSIRHDDNRLIIKKKCNKRMVKNVIWSTELSVAMVTIAFASLKLLFSFIFSLNISLVLLGSQRYLFIKCRESNCKWKHPSHLVTSCLSSIFHTARWSELRWEMRWLAAVSFTRHETVLTLSYSSSSSSPFVSLCLLANLEIQYKSGPPSKCVRSHPLAG